MIRGEGEFEVLRPAGAGGEPPTSGGGGPRGVARVADDRPEIRPRGVGEVLDFGIELLRDRFAICVGVSAALWLPARLLHPFLGMHAWMQGGGDWRPLAGMAGWGVNLMADFLVQTLATACVSLLVASRAQGRTTPISEVFRGAQSRLLVLLALSIVIGLATTIGVFLCFVPGIVLSWKLAVAPAVCVLEDGGVGESLSRSFELTRRCFLRWLGVFIVLALLTMTFSSVTAVGDQPALRASIVSSLSISGPLFDWTLVILSSLFNGVATAITAAVTTAFYLDCRARREGTDLRLRLARLTRIASAGADPGASAAASGGSPA